MPAGRYTYNRQVKAVLYYIEDCILKVITFVIQCTLAVCHLDQSSGHNCENYHCWLIGHHRYICMYGWYHTRIFVPIITCLIAWRLECICSFYCINDFFFLACPLGSLLLFVLFTFYGRMYKIENYHIFFYQKHNQIN
jgi:hypothetical protein